MKKNYSKRAWRLTATVSFAAAMTAFDVCADSLPTDPWAAAEEQQQSYQQQVPAAAPGVVQVQQVGPVVYGSQPYQPTYEGGDSNIWNTKMPEFTGEMTTWGDSPNAKYNAPEVNIHNMISITQHLRNMGYQIPDTFESKITKAPAAVRERIFQAMKELKRNNDPASTTFRFALKQFENETGLSYENLVGNTLNLLSAK